MLLQLIAKVWKKLPRGSRAWISRSIQPRFTVSAAGIITNSEGKVLLLNHVLRPSSGWGVPGGFMEFGEQGEAALRREIREETGLEVRDVSLYKTRTFNKHIELIFTAKSDGEGEVLTREITELGWFDIDKMPEEMSVDQHFLVRKALGVDG